MIFLSGYVEIAMDVQGKEEKVKLFLSDQDPVSLDIGERSSAHFNENGLIKMCSVLRFIWQPDVSAVDC